MQEISERIAEGVTLSGAGEPVGLCADDTLENPGGRTPGAVRLTAASTKSPIAGNDAVTIDATDAEVSLTPRFSAA